MAWRRTLRHTLGALEVPFPFVFAQMVWVLLAFFSVVPVPFMCALGLDESRAAGYTCVVVFVFWAAHRTAVELEMPFGTDANDLPLDEAILEMGGARPLLCSLPLERSAGPRWVVFSWARGF